MNLRRFSLAFTVAVMVLLVASGVYALNYIGSFNTKDEKPPKGAIAEVISGLVRIKDPVNVLLLVSDRTAVNTDTIMVMNYNPETAAISVLSIPRDTKVNEKLKVPKINSLYYLGGADFLIKNINELFGINIKYYMYIDISTFKEVVDLLGGVDFNVPARLKYDDDVQNLHIDLQKGLQHLDGDHAEQLLRFRHPNTYKNNKELRQYYDGSDLKRINIQQDFIRELIKQKANMNYFTSINSILNTIFENINETNINLTDALRLSYNISKINPNKLNTFKMLGVNGNSSISYYIYNGKFINTVTNEELDGVTVVSQYFYSKFGFDGSTVVKNKPTVKSSDYTPKKSSTNKSNTGTKKSFTKNNPSNSTSSFKGKIKPDP